MIQKNIYVLIMAGGVGSRFWPKSRNHFPKQFIDILGTGQSLLQMTYARFLQICPKENIYILSNQDYKGLVLEQLDGITERNILLEPSRNNTAPCIAYATYKILQENPEANIVVAPSDHLILKEAAFLDKIKQALDYTSKNDALLTLGISPTRPDTGYGYIHFEQVAVASVHTVNRFMEKPVLEKAKEYLASGDYLWNAGIFIWSAQSIQQAFQTHAPEIANLFEQGKPFYNTPDEVGFIEEHYPKSPNISIDYAILEKATNVFTIPADIGWSDLGTWASLHEVLPKDALNNTKSIDHLHVEGTSNCIIHLPKGKAAVIKGLEDYIIVDDEKVLLIYPKSCEQEIKGVAGEMVRTFGEEYL
ncbi:mannose-1-phosphate guanylyltransferase (GDP) [Flavobacterium succinicans]|uniref:mannose-1-phosphate guanylyltransferase n=1 Tax=Flavobacterium succinicans TaxID=29536 RepID=A0A1I4SEB9_9FLAO|nr:mannose-1-phosphate guanylyltransferase [Flavobacterium succinicans]SFM62838.1 mannose-1-phosphate guanylyltransferase (GDP) [Flavobacterium succinicans]